MGLLGVLLLLGHLRARRHAPPPPGPPEPARWEGPDIVIVLLIVVALQWLAVTWGERVGLLERTAGLIIVSALGNIAAAVIALAFIARRGQGPAALGVPPREGGALRAAGIGVRYFLMAFPFVYGLHYAMRSAFAALEREPRLNPAVELFLRTDAPLDLLVVLVAALVVAPVAEEVLFRGFLYGPLRAAWGRRAAIAVTAVLFGLVHPLVDALPIAVLGVALALSYERSGSLVAPIAAHLANNAYGVLVLVIHRLAGGGPT